MGRWSLSNAAGVVTNTCIIPHPLSSGYKYVVPHQSGRMEINGTYIGATAYQRYEITTDDSISMSASAQPNTNLGSWSVGPIEFEIY